MNNCPFLGLDEDPQTLIGFSSDRNYCYRTEKPTSIPVLHQQKYCLTKTHPHCPVYQDLSHLTLPIEIASRSQPVRKRSIPRGVWVTGTVLILAGSLALGWLAFGQPASPVAAVPVNTLPLTATASPLPTRPKPISVFKNTSTLSPSPTPSETPTVTPTPTQMTTLPLGLETPSVGTPQLLIHQIGPGDSLNQLAEKHGTSVEAIRRVNYFLPVPLWQGLMIVIPLKTTEVSALPAFQPFQVVDGALRMEDLAWALNTSPELVSRYNQVDPKAVLPVGSWLLIPLSTPPPTGLPLATLEGKIEK